MRGAGRIDFVWVISYLSEGIAMGEREGVLTNLSCCSSNYVTAQFF
jgi:hypothetical protein